MQPWPPNLKTYEDLAERLLHKKCDLTFLPKDYDSPQTSGPKGVIFFSGKNERGAALKFT